MVGHQPCPDHSENADLRNQRDQCLGRRLEAWFLEVEQTLGRTGERERGQGAGCEEAAQPQRYERVPTSSL